MDAIKFLKESNRLCRSLTNSGCKECPIYPFYRYGCILYSEVKPERMEEAAVRHGRWEECDWIEYDGHGEYIGYHKEALRCSNCANVFKKELLWKDNYCPNCGAKMDEEK